MEACKAIPFGGCVSADWGVFSVRRVDGYWVVSVLDADPFQPAVRVTAVLKEPGLALGFDVSARLASIARTAAEAVRGRTGGASGA